jgi:putative endonuclease
VHLVRSDGNTQSNSSDTPHRKSPDARRELGRRGEDQAALHLERLGFRLLARNVRTRFGEIDLIAYDGEVLVFAEVKTRRHHNRGTNQPHHAADIPHPLELLKSQQRARLRRLASAWLAATDDRPWAQTIRFDAIGVVLDQAQRLLSLEHLEAAW